MSESPGQDVKIDDPEQISQAKRIHELLGRRKRVIDARDEAFDAQLLGQASHDEALEYYRSRIESLIIDLYTKFTSEGIENGQHYLEEAVIDTIEVPPPEEFRAGPDGDIGPGQSTPEPKYLEIRGLEWFLNHDGQIQVPFTARTFNPPGERTIMQEISVPRKTLDKALLTCIKFLDDAGIDADLTEEEQQTKITRELLEEVEEWRKQNVEGVE